MPNQTAAVFFVFSFQCWICFTHVLRHVRVTNEETKPCESKMYIESQTNYNNLGCETMMYIFVLSGQSLAVFFAWKWKKREGSEKVIWSK